MLLDFLLLIHDLNILSGILGRVFCGTIKLRQWTVNHNFSSVFRFPFPELS